MKKYFLLITMLFFLLAENSFSQIKISAMPLHTSKPTGADVPIVIGGVNKRVKADSIAAIANHYADSVAALNGIDTAMTLAAYQTAINARMKYTDTPALLLAYQTALNIRLKYTDTSAMLAAYQTALNVRMKYSDSSGMLLAYQDALNARIKYTDSAGILLAYQTALNERLKYADTAAMLLAYQLALNDRLNSSTSRTAYTIYGNNTGSSAVPTFFTNNFSDSLKRSNDSIYRRVNGSWYFQFKDSVGSGGGGSTLYAGVGLKKSADSTRLYTDSTIVPVINDVFNMPEIQTWTPAQGLAATNAVANYGFGSLDSIPYYFTTVAGGVGTENGGVLVNSTSGDSIQVSAPIGVAIGHSIIAGHPGVYSGLENNDLDQLDEYGTITYKLSQLTNMEWKNMGIGGQTTVDIRKRFMRDAVGLTADAGDGKPTRTLSHKPSIVLIDAIVNDPFNSVPVETTKANLTWMAQTLAEYQIPCVMLNSEGQGGVVTKAQLAGVAELNRWLGTGALNQYGVTVVDNNSYWNSGIYGGMSRYGNDNNHQSNDTLVETDHIHYTKLGYDSLAGIIARVAKLPVLTKALFVTGLNPATPITNYNRPTGITMNGVAYALPNAVYDTINITAPTKDSMWIKITSSTNVTGSSTQTGFNAIYYYLTNNPTNNKWYTRKLNFTGARVSNTTASTVEIIPDRIGTNIPFKIKQNSSFSPSNQNAFVVTNTGSSSTTVINGQGSTAQINGAILSVYQTGGAGIATDGTYYSTAVNHRFGSFQFGNTSSASTTGTGIGIYNTGMQFQYVGGSNNTPTYMFSQFNSATPSITTNSIMHGVISTNIGVGSITSNNDSVCGYYYNPTFNNSSFGGFRNSLGGFIFKPTVTAIQNTRLLGFMNTRGDNLLNTQGEKTAIGTLDPAGSAKLDVTGNKQGFIPPRMSTASRDSIGYISAISVTPGSYSVLPTLTITGGTGSGAQLAYYLAGGATSLTAYLINPGVGYKTSSTPTVNFSGGTGSGGSATLTVHGPDDGLIIYNIDSNKLNVASGEVWYQIPKVLINTATLDFGSTAAGASTDLTITVTGAVDGDMVSLGVPNGSMPVNGIFRAWVSSANTVTVRYANNDLVTSYDPASGTFKVQVFK